VEFEARKLRVQLPCGSQTLIACVFGTCRLPSMITCIYRTTFPTDCGTTIWETETIFQITEQIQPQLEVEELDILREQLEGQLKEVISAQQAVAKQGKTK
jgi:hypothetical protein